MKQKLGSSLLITFFLMSSCSNEANNSAEEQVLEKINLVCEGDETFVRDHKVEYIKPIKKVYRFTRTDQDTHLYGYVKGPNDKILGVHINDDELRMYWETEKDDDGWYHQQSITINRFTGDVEDMHMHWSSLNLERTFKGSCISQDQKF